MTSKWVVPEAAKIRHCCALKAEVCPNIRAPQSETDTDDMACISAKSWIRCHRLRRSLSKCNFGQFQLLQAPPVASHCFTYPDATCPLN